MLDIYGNNIGGAGGYETEEEKRRRLEEEAANATPVTQTIKTNPVTGEQEMTIKGTPQDLSAANPLTPTVTAPVNPADTFGRMIQAESGGRQYNAQGGILTSPAGAQGMAQVMPATAANPGYGVKPATPEEIATPEGNRAFGERYFQGLLQHFGGDQAKATAAYNAGPGRVQQNMQANAGQMNSQQLPKETQGYLQKVLGAVNPIGTANAAAPAPTLQNTPLQAPAPADQSLMPQMTAPATNAFPGTPSAQMPGQQPAPVAPPAPVAQAPAPTPQGPVNPAAPVAQAPVAQAPVAQAPVAQPPMQQAGPPTNLMNPTGWAERLNTAKQDDRQLAGLAYDPNTPQYVREEASSDLYKRLQAAKNEAATKAKLQEGIASGDMSEINRIMKKGGEEGSWMKYLFFGLLGSDAAKLERQKLFPEMDSKVVSFIGQDGKQGLIRQAADGSPLYGRFDDGKELSSKQLIQYAQGALGGKHDYVGGSVVNDSTKQIGRIVSQNGRTMVESGGRLYPATTEWRNNTVGTDVANAARMALVDIQKRGAGKAAEVIAETNAKFGTNFSADDAGLAAIQRIANGGNAVAATTGQPGAAVGAPQVGGGPTTPAQAENINAPKAGVAKAGGEVLAAESEWKDKIDIINEGIKGAKGKNNLGTIATGVLPFEQSLGKSVMSSKDARNTDAALNAVKTVSAAGMKALGANPTDADRDYLTKNIPDESWNGPDVADWLESRKKFVQRKIDTAREQVRSGGESAVPASAPGTPGNPIKLSL
jgi:Transglycosylase SLT domain